MAVKIMRAFCTAVIASAIGILAAALLVAIRANAADLGQRCWIGDSLGVGMSISVSLPKDLRLAKEGTLTIAAVEQIKRCPPGSIGIISDGTNDAAFPGNRLATFAHQYEIVVDRVIAAADAQGVTLIWYAPPKVPYAWDRYSQIAADTIKARLAGTDHRYVETRNRKWCALRAPDGVHFYIPRGYRAFYAAGAR
ncbi:MAG: SGNH/GDSL hydrolase family protein [Xanthobacteraceae bacterium]|nr:SGNH/GDSL hydrolase family protein [Xanthobacteraceae bacterium]